VPSAVKTMNCIIAITAFIAVFFIAAVVSQGLV